MINYYKFDVLWMDEVIAFVDLKPENGSSPYVENYINGFNKQFSPENNGFITPQEIEKWLSWRTFPETRANRDELLKSLGLNSYNRWAIIRKTHGVMADDEIWVRFKGEIITHREVCLRKYLYYPEDDNQLHSKII